MKRFSQRLGSSSTLGLLPRLSSPTALRTLHAGGTSGGVSSQTASLDLDSIPAGAGSSRRAELLQELGKRAFSNAASSMLQESSGSSAPTPSSSSSSSVQQQHQDPTVGNAQPVSQTMLNPYNGRLIRRDGALGMKFQRIGMDVCPQTHYLKLQDGEKYVAYLTQLQSMLPVDRDKELRDLPARLQRSIRYFLKSNNIDSASEQTAHQLHQLRSRLSEARLTGVISSSEADNDHAQMSQSLGPSTNVSAANLNADQSAALSLALAGFNLFIGGSAGTGKTLLLEGIRREMVKRGLSVAMTATTGIASCHIGGTTFHHTFHCSIAEEFRKAEPLRRYDVIIIDEISMLSSTMLSRFDQALRAANDAPGVVFGGVQLIFCGDFLQLAPIDAETVIHNDLFKNHFVHCRLSQIVRQSSNPQYAQCLEQIRKGIVPDNILKMIPNHKTPKIFPDAVNLLPTNSMVGKVNQEQLSKIDGDEFSFPALIHTPTLMKDTTNTLLLQVVKKKGGPAAAPTTASSSLSSSSLASSPINFFHLRKTILNFVESYASENNMSLSYLKTRLSLYRLYDDAFVARFALDTLLYKPFVDTSGNEAQKKALLEGVLDGSEDDVASMADAAKPNTKKGLQPLKNGEFPRSEEQLKHAREANEMLAALMEHLNTEECIGRTGVRVLEKLENGTGMHTPHDEEKLHSMAKGHPLLQSTNTFKIGARVLLRANITSTLVNGSIGKIIDFVQITSNMKYNIACNKHNEARVLEHIAEYTRFMQSEGVTPEQLGLPVVQFGEGENAQSWVIPPWRITLGGFEATNYYGVSAFCIPLSLAYAFTVHKVQGLTLVGRVHLELSKMWPCEHLLYVAMSRVKTPEQLTMSCFREDMILSDRDSVDYSSSLVPASRIDTEKYDHILRASWKRFPGQRKKQIQEKAKLRKGGTSREKRALRNSQVDSEIDAKVAAQISSDPDAKRQQKQSSSESALPAFAPGVAKRTPPPSTAPASNGSSAFNNNSGTGFGQDFVTVRSSGFSSNFGSSASSDPDVQKRKKTIVMKTPVKVSPVAASPHSQEGQKREVTSSTAAAGGVDATPPSPKQPRQKRPKKTAAPEEGKKSKNKNAAKSPPSEPTKPAGVAATKTRKPREPRLKGRSSKTTSKEQSTKQEPSLNLAQRDVFEL